MPRKGTIRPDVAFRELRAARRVKARERAAQPPVKPMMLCGHVANATTASGAPVCVICVGINDGADRIDLRVLDLSGRRARCCSEASIVPSSLSLAFFEYNGPGSPRSFEQCRWCGFNRCTHSDVMAINPYTERPNGPCRAGKAFEPAGPSEFDHYYCGCRGWD